MKSSHTPTKHAIPFGQNGNKRDIPQETKTGSGEASLSLGFPPETMVPKVSGGIPPSGKDFNGILNELSAMGRWANAGAGYPFDAAFANAIGGYPAGAKIPNSENNGFWLNTVDSNLDNPEVTDGRLTGWVPAENYGIATLSGLAKADVTLTALQAAKARIVLTGDLKGNVAVIFPAWQKSWTVVNQCTGSGSLICRTKAGAGVVVPNGELREIVGDGSGLVQRIVNATTSVVGIAQLSSATDSDSETMAATPKAVKELAAQTLAKDQNGADIPDPARFIKNLGLQAQLSGRVLRIKKITQSQTYHWPDDVAAIDVTLCGGGGGGGAGASSPAGHGSAGSGGGGGGWARSYYQRGSIPAAVKIDIGKGGQGGVADGQQPAGGSPSLFGDLIKVYGGANALNGPVFRKGSQPVLVGNGGGGDASGGNLFSSRGGSGTPALFLGISHESGAGGDSVFSFGAPPLAHDHTVAGFAGVDGAGGGGGFVIENSAGANGGNGGGGVCLIVEYSA